MPKNGSRLQLKETLARWEAYATDGTGSLWRNPRPECSGPWWDRYAPPFVCLHAIEPPTAYLDASGAVRHDGRSISPGACPFTPIINCPSIAVALW